MDQFLKAKQWAYPNKKIGCRFIVCGEKLRWMRDQLFTKPLPKHCQLFAETCDQSGYSWSGAEHKGEGWGGGGAVCWSLSNRIKKRKKTAAVVINWINHSPKRHLMRDFRVCVLNNVHFVVSCVEKVFSDRLLLRDFFVCVLFFFFFKTVQACTINSDK